MMLSNGFITQRQRGIRMLMVGIFNAVSVFFFLSKKVFEMLYKVEFVRILLWT